jgi:hypothetical protein
MPRCLLAVEGADHDITNLLTEGSLRDFASRCRLADAAVTARQGRCEPQDDCTVVLEEILHQYDQYRQQQRQQRRRQHQLSDWGTWLYPNLRDPCNRRLIEDVAPMEWNAVPLARLDEKFSSSIEAQQAQELIRQQQQEQADRTTELQRACSAPMHHHPSDDRRSRQRSYLSPQMVRPNRQLEPRSSPTDIYSAASGLRPRINYKAIYSRRRCTAPPTLDTNASSASCWNGNNSSSDDQQDFLQRSTSTATTMMMGGSQTSFSDDLSIITDHEDSYDHHPHHVLHEESGPSPRTLEISPNVHVPVRPSQETYQAVSSGDYTVTTCFACCVAIVCVKNAAYVLCPDCQVVSPLGFATSEAASCDASKKEDPYGIGTGLKREWVDDLLEV